MRCARSSSLGRRWPLVPILAGLALAFAGSARATILPDIPLVWRPPTGARAAGMAGAYVAIADDYEALLQNPAALARVVRPEISGTVERRSPKQEITFLGHREVSQITKTRIQALGFAYPFPVARGSLVVGMAYDRAIPMDSEYYRAGAGGPVGSENESIIEEGGIGAWTSGVAFDLSPTLSFGASGTILSGSSQRDRTFHYRSATSPDYEDTKSSTSNSGINAVTGTIGALLQPSKSVRVGIALHLPEAFTLDGKFTRDIRHYREAVYNPHGDQISPGDTLDYAEDYNFKYKLNLPLRVSMGLALTAGGALTGLTVTGQADLADWTQMELAGSTLRTDDRQYAYRSVTELRVGLEYARELALTSSSRLPLRLRAGYASIPVPYRFVGTDIFLGEAAPARFSPDRSLLSAGFGVGLDPNTMLDAAWTHTNFERSAQSSAGVVTRERVSENSVLVGVSFRI
jgi:long-subunit fatty acid transport protein